MNSARVVRLAVWLKLRRPRYGTDPRAGLLDHTDFGALEPGSTRIFSALRISPLQTVGLSASKYRPRCSPAPTK